MLDTLIKLSTKRLLLPLYHLVSNDINPYAQYLYKVKSVEEFKSDIDFILKHFIPVGISEIIEHNVNQKPFKKNAVYFTFDDGLKEMREVVAPILLEKGIEAAFFVNPDFIDNKDLFHRYKAGLLINKIEKGNLSNAKKSELERSLGSKSLIKEILKIDYSNKAKLDKLAEILEVDFAEFLKKHTPYLSKGDLDWLIDKGFTVGAHSMDHPHFYKLNEQVQIQQTLESINWVEKNFKPQYNLFAFPFTDYGVKKSFFDQLKAKVSIDLTFGCAGIKDDEILFNLQRLPMDKESSSAKRIIRKEYRNYILKRIIREHKICR